MHESSLMDKLTDAVERRTVVLLMHSSVEWCVLSYVVVVIGQWHIVYCRQTLCLINSLYYKFRRIQKATVCCKLALPYCTETGRIIF